MVASSQRKTMVVITVILLTALAFGFLTYKRIFQERNYIISGQASCDPEAESCFIEECDPEIDECTGDPIEDTSYYKLIRKSASNIPLCDPLSEQCAELSCRGEEENCEETLCEPTDDQTCEDPQTFEEKFGTSGDTPEADEETLDDTEDGVSDDLAPSDQELIENPQLVQ